MFWRFRLLSASEHLCLWGLGLGALVSMAMIVEEPLDGTLCLLFCGGGCAFFVFEWRDRAADEAVAEIGHFARRVARHDIAGYRRLVEKVAPLRGRRAAGVLVEMSGCARLMDGLFFHARRREIGGLPEVGGEPLSWALASLNPDGYVRAAAVAEMGRKPRPEFVPFLVDRAVERVDAVRSAALAVLREILADESARVPIARSFSRVARRRHAGGLAELLGFAPGQPGLGPYSKVFTLCETKSRWYMVYGRGAAGRSWAPVCREHGDYLGQSCHLVVRQRRAREQSGTDRWATRQPACFVTRYPHIGMSGRCTATLRRATPSPTGRAVRHSL